MMSNYESAQIILQQNSHLLILQQNYHLLGVALFGGFVLYGFKIADHFNRAPEDKMPLSKYWFYALSLFFVLPLLGVCVTAIYLMNGDGLSTILSFQVGLTSPAIVHSMIIFKANKMGKERITVTDDQQ
jgi:hypothetical protein